MTDHNLPPIPMPEFSDEQVRALLDYCEAAARSRYQGQGADFSEIDFLCGVMSVLFALQKQDKIPAGWIFGPMANRSPLDLPDLDQTAYVVYDPLDEQRPVTVYKHKGEAEEHVNFLEGEQDNTEAYVIGVPIRHALRPDVQQGIEAVDAAADAQEGRS